ncbi:MAG: DUF1778 domain-containing protein [Pirellulales bacterium]|nr:DUF1778 domain-containing protein [Pirellulales bacterium]
MSQMARIDIRTDARRKGLLVRAAELTHTNLTQFILDRVIPEAERIVVEKEEQKVVMPADAWTEFCKLLDSAPRDLPNMRALLARPSRFSDSDA